MTPSVASAGPASGSTTDRNVLKRLAPSTYAASSISTGMPMKNWRMKNTPNTPARWGRMYAGIVARPRNGMTLPSCRMIRNCGTRNMTAGSSSVAMSRLNSSDLPGKSIRANA